MTNIREFYANQTIFITGATGFIGKVLIEKLLRSCPGVKSIYVLIREHKGKTVEQRLSDIFNYPLFDKLKESQPDSLKKVHAVEGDVTELGLALSDANRKLLIDNVSVIFHGAASVRFDDHLSEAIILNTRGTRELINLALEMKNLVVLLHISTTYCNIDHVEVQEHLYPPHADWRKSIEIAEKIDPHTLTVLTSKYIDVLPNTYTFSKSLGEHVVYDLCKDRIPAVVVRPSIVISSWKDPIPGWIDNFNGPVALLVASGKGILRSCYTKPSLKADYMPVDLSCRALLLAAWQKGIEKDPTKKLDVSYYNCSSNYSETLTIKEMIDFGEQIFWEAPLSNILWFPGGSVTGCKYWNYLRVIFLHLLPAVIIDGILRLLDKKPILVKVQRRIYIANMALQYFITNQWSFPNEKCRSLEDNLAPEEEEEFGYNAEGINVYEFFRNCIFHGRRYLMKEKDENIESAKKNLLRMYVLDKIVNWLIYAFLFWFFVYKLEAPSYLTGKVRSMFSFSFLTQETMAQPI